MKILVIGGGYAGTILSYFLIRKGAEVTLVDKQRTSTSTKVSAGIMLPITGRRLAKTYLADLLIPFATDIYKQVGSQSGITFYHSKDVLQLFTGNGNRNEWFARSGDHDATEYIGEMLDESEIDPAIRNSHGGILLKQSGFVDPLKLLEAFKKVSGNRLKLIDELVNYADINERKQTWKDEPFDRIIFCEGYQCMNNPYFNYIPFKPAKGEIIDFAAEKLDNRYIINGNVFILPLENGTFRAGSTYNWDDLTDTPTQEGKTELANGISRLLNCEFTITDHQAGIRPSIRDRRPVIGLHPEYSSLGVFNGLGTKGVMLAPYFADQFAGFLFDGRPLNEDVNAERFRKWYQEP